MAADANTLCSAECKSHTISIVRYVVSAPEIREKPFVWAPNRVTNRATFQLLRHDLSTAAIVVFQVSARSNKMKELAVGDFLKMKITK